MLMCIDAIKRIKEVEYQIKLKKSLTPKKTKRSDKTPSRKYRKVRSTYGYRSVGRSSNFQSNMQQTFSTRMNQTVVTEI